MAHPKCEVVPRVTCNEAKTKQRNLLFLSSLISQSALSLRLHPSGGSHFGSGFCVVICEIKTTAHRSVRPTFLLMCQDKSDLLKTRVAGGLNKSRRPGTAGLFRLAGRLLVFTRYIHAALVSRTPQPCRLWTRWRGYRWSSVVGGHATDATKTRPLMDGTGWSSRDMRGWVSK